MLTMALLDGLPPPGEWRVGAGSREECGGKESPPLRGHHVILLGAQRKSREGTGYHHQFTSEREITKMNPKRNVTCEHQPATEPLREVAVQSPFL